MKSNALNNFSFKISIFIALVIILLSTGLWYQNQITTKNTIEQDQEDIVKHTEYLLSRSIKENIEIVQSLFVNQWLDVNDTSLLNDKQRFEQHIGAFYQFYEGYQALNYLLPNGTVQWVYPEADNQDLLNESLFYLADGSINTKFLEATEDRVITATTYIPLYQGGFGIASYIPVIYKGDLIAIVNVVLRVGPILDDFIKSETNLDEYKLTIRAHEGIKYPYESNFDISGSYVKNGTLEYYGVEWDIFIKLGPTLQTEISFWQNIYIPIIGLILGIFVVIISWQEITKNQVQKQRFEERQNYEKLLHQSEKMSALGTLAGGIAHDFNNLLMGLQANIELLKVTLEEQPDDKISGILDNLENTMLSTRDLTNQILVFSRQSEVKNVELKVDEVLDHTLRIFKSGIDKRISVQVNNTATETTIIANMSRLSQSFLNILNNASDAIKGQGLIEIQITNVIDPDNNLFNQNLDNSSNLIKISFSDTGEGIREEDLNKIFDPFYTTKKMGKGTGLGLAMVYQYIDSIGGKIRVKSQSDIGTTVNIFLPLQKTDDLIHVAVDDPDMFDDKLGQYYQSKFGHEPRILLLEDEETIAQALIRLLHQESFITNHVSTGQLALNEDIDYYDLFILDVNLPDIPGTEVAKQIMEQYPSKHIIFITGFTEADLNKKSLENIEVVQKPFSFQEILMVIKQELSK